MSIEILFVEYNSKEIGGRFPWSYRYELKENRKYAHYYYRSFNEYYGFVFTKITRIKIKGL